MEMTMEFNKETGKIGLLGTLVNAIEIEMVETEIEGGFRIEGTTPEGEKVVAELSTEDYFEGKFFEAGKVLN